MVDPIRPSANLPVSTERLLEQQRARTTPVVKPVPQSSGSEFAGAGGGGRAGLRIGSGKGNGGEINVGGGGDKFGGFYREAAGNLAATTPIANGSVELSDRDYLFDKTGRFSRKEMEWQIEFGQPGASKGASGRVVWDNNPVTPESSGREWDQLGSVKTVERTGAGSLERDGASGGIHGVIFGTEYDHRFNPEGFRYERNDYIGAGAFWERDVLGLVTYDPPSANVYTTDKLGAGIARFSLYGSQMEHERFDSSWTLDLDSQYRGGTPGVFDEAARERAVASHAQLSLPARNAEVLESQRLGSQEAYLSHIQETIERTSLPANLVVERMHLAVHQAGIAIDDDPSRSAGEAFARQPAIDRRAPIEAALSQGLPPAAALDIALARSQGDMRPVQDILNSSTSDGMSTPTDFANDAVAFEAIYSEMSGARPNFDAIVAAGETYRSGDTRSAGALVTDYHDNGVIDGSNLVYARFGDETHAVLPGGGVQMVSQPDGTLTPVASMRPETAKSLLSMVDTAQNQDQTVKTETAKAVFYDAKQRGASFEEQRALYHGTRNAQEFEGDNRNADALIADSRDNGVIDGSNLPEATIGDQTYAVSTGGGVMHGRTTMTPSEIAARANARAAFGGDVVSDAVAKAQADAMAQSLRLGFSSRDQIAVTDPTATIPGEAAAVVRQKLEAIAGSDEGAALVDQERVALEGMIDEARKIEEAVKYAGVISLADSEYDVSLEVQERTALDAMIAEANKMDALADIPIPGVRPAFAPAELAKPVESDGPDLRGENVAYGRGTIENAPSGKNVSYDSLSDWGKDLSDMFSGDGPKAGVATPNETEQKEAKEQAEAKAEEKAEKEAEEKAAAEKKAKAEEREGGESRGQQGPSENEQRDFGGSASDFADSGGLL